MRQSRQARTRFIGALLIGALLGLGACKKSEDKEKPNFSTALKRLNAAVAPVDFEWPLVHLRTISDGDGKEDTRNAARFELARGWLRLSVLTMLPGEAREAGRVLTATGCKKPENIIAAFDQVANAGEIEGTEIPAWAKDGAALVRAVGSEEGEAADRRAAVTEMALGKGAFSSAAASFVFVDLLVVPPRKLPEGVKPFEEKEVERRLRKVVRYACPKDYGLLKAKEGGPARADRLAALAVACKPDAWLGGKDLQTLATKGVCGDLAGKDASAARTLMAAFLNRLIGAYSEPGSTPKPAVLHARFSAQRLCPASMSFLDRLITE